MPGSVLNDPGPPAASAQSQTKARQVIVERDVIGLASQQRDSADTLFRKFHGVPPVRFWEAYGKRATASQSFLVPLSDAGYGIVFEKTQRSCCFPPAPAW